MKSTLLAFTLGVLACLGAGCGGMQVQGESASDPNRVATGSVELGDAVAPSPDMSVTVRVVDLAHKDFKDPNAVLGVHSSTPAIAQPPEMLAEQKIDHVTSSSVPFAVKFYASDEQMTGGLILEARVSIKGKVRFFNLESYALNSGNIDTPRRIYVNEVR